MIAIKRAKDADIPTIESILLNAVNWLNERGTPLWTVEDASWARLSAEYSASDFYIAFNDGDAIGCMALVDYDPVFWGDSQQGETVILHKLAVVKTARKIGVGDSLVDYAKNVCRSIKIPLLRLDCDINRPRLHAFYKRHGFVCVGTKTVSFIDHPKFETALFECHL
jgi:N-acetylglutamate synthase-like GNAT family acetyltransferase